MKLSFELIMWYTILALAVSCRMTLFQSHECGQWTCTIFHHFGCQICFLLLVKFSPFSSCSWLTAVQKTVRLKLCSLNEQKNQNSSLFMRWRPWKETLKVHLNFLKAKKSQSSSQLLKGEVVANLETKEVAVLKTIIVTENCTNSIMSFWCSFQIWLSL